MPIGVGDHLAGMHHQAHPQALGRWRPPVVDGELVGEGGDQRVQQPGDQHLGGHKEQDTVAGSLPVGLGRVDVSLPEGVVEQPVQAGSHPYADGVSPRCACEVLDVEREDTPVGWLVPHPVLS